VVVTEVFAPMIGISDCISFMLFKIRFCYKLLAVLFGSKSHKVVPSLTP